MPTPAYLDGSNNLISPRKRPAASGADNPPPWKAAPSNGATVTETRQHGGARPDAGRKPGDVPGGMSRQALVAAGELYNLAAADRAGAYVSDLQTDAARLQAYGLSYLALVGSYALATVQPDGYWVLLHRGTIASFHALVRRCRRDMLDGLDERLQAAGMEGKAQRAAYSRSLAATFLDGQRYIADLLAYVLTWAGDSDVKLERVSSTDFTRGHYLPTDDKDNRSIDLTSGEWVTPDTVRAARCLAPYGGMRVKAADYQPAMDMDNPPPAYAAMRRFLSDAHWGWPLVTRLASHLLGTSKDIDCIICPVANAGKDTLLDALKRATGNGAWIDPSSKTLKERGSHFSQATTPLTDNYFAFYNEMDKLPEVAPGLVNSLTADTLLIERKGVDPREVQRIGQPVFVGADYPPINVDVQGVRNRFRWVWRKDDLEPISYDQRVAILSGTAYLLTALVKEAVKLHALRDVDGEGKDGACDEGLEAAAEMHEALTSEAAQLVKSLLEADDKGFVSVADLKHLFEDVHGVDFPDAREMRRHIQAAFPRAKPSRPTKHGKQVRGYAGVKLADDAHTHDADSDADATTDADADGIAVTPPLAPGFEGQSND